MSLVVVPQVNPNDEVTALSVNQGPNAIAAVVNGNIDDTNVSTLSGTKITAGTVPVAAFDTASNPETRESETHGDLVASGLVWSTLTGLNGTMSSGVAYVSGKRLVVASVATYAFTASRDTYVYVDNTGAIQYSPQTNGAAQPATPANNQLIAKVVTNGSTITGISDLRVIGLSSQWKTWSPTITGVTIGNGTVVQRYTRIGTTVHLEFHLAFGSTTAVTGIPTFTLPMAANSLYPSGFSSPIGTCALEDAGTMVAYGSVFLSSATTLYLNVWNAASTYVRDASISATVPHTWAINDNIGFFATYEAAV